MEYQCFVSRFVYSMELGEYFANTWKGRAAWFSSANPLFADLASDLHAYMSPLVIGISLYTYLLRKLTNLLVLKYVCSGIWRLDLLSFNGTVFPGLILFLPMPDSDWFVGFYCVTKNDVHLFVLMVLWISVAVLARIKSWWWLFLKYACTKSA